MSVGEILNDREDEYGNAEFNFERIGRIWSLIIDSEMEAIPAWKVALMLDAMKTVRILANPTHMDSWYDKLGYTTLGVNIVDRTD